MRFAALASVLFLLAGWEVSFSAEPQSRYIRGPSGNRTVIIFVHGVLGDATTTWTNDRTRAYWPDLLAHDHSFDGCDVYVYEYPSPKLSNSYSPNEIAENMRLLFNSDDISRHESIIFLTHSLGGVVTRAFLTKYREVAKRVKFVYFFATPTTGSEVSRLGALISKNPQFDRLRTMTSDASLADLQRDWLAASFTFPSYCAYEIQKTAGKLIVEQQSATNLCTKHLDPIDANHFDIVKPESTRSASYLAFRDAFKEVMGTSTAGVPLPIHSRIARPTPRRGAEVLVADFDGPDPKRYRVTETLLNQLKQAFKGLPDFNIEALGKPITEQQGAETAVKEGRSHQVMVVNWGWYGQGNDKSVVTTHFQLIRPSQHPVMKSDTQDLRVPTADLENFTLQYRLSNDAVAFTEATLALLRFEKGDYAAAISYLNNVLANDSLPSSVLQRSPLLFYRGTAHSEAGNLDAGLADLTAVISAEPDQWPAYLNRGTIYHRQGQIENAIADYDQALVRAPDSPQVHYARGLALARQNRSS
jgi:pimeloyl-ACP methyl ester carboxylesterase/predicted negative regulator of RcsB-dependent stress response